MKILGISDSKLESGLAYVKDGKLDFALNEERVTRVKIDGGFPTKSLKIFYKKYENELNSIDMIVFGGIFTPTPMSRFFDWIIKFDKNMNNSKFDFIYEYIIYLITYKFRLLSSVRNSKKKSKLMIWLLKKTLRAKLDKRISNKPIFLVDHHECHIASAFFCSGFDKALVASFDGFGDGSSAKIFIGEKNRLKEIKRIAALKSFGLYYSLITQALGFTPEKHEGKITGLAAYGNHKNVREEYPIKVKIRNDKVKIENNSFGGYKELRRIKKSFLKYKKEDIAAWVQYNTEQSVCKIVKHYMKKNNQSNLCLAGGLLANVKINQKLHELDEVKEIYIYPAMSDSGISHGAILTMNKQIDILNNIYFGPEYSSFEIEMELKKQNIKYICYKNIEKEIAKKLSEGKIVARFNGRMEYGPRALGNRSILVQATDVSINDKLNKKLKRTEFMPFAPTILDKKASKCLRNLAGAKLTSKFMNISFEVTDYMKQNCPASVHIDGTARPQIIFKRDNKSYYKILEEYFRITGLPAILNTSFNVHEEPIVMTPKDALKGFKKANLDYLAIDNFMIKNDS